jgi:Reverse transcriptase (RNA-dependent DNA polymerase)
MPQAPQIWMPSSTGISARTLITTPVTKSEDDNREWVDEEQEPAEAEMPGALMPEVIMQSQVTPVAPAAPAKQKQVTQEVQRSARISKLTEKKLASIEKLTASSSQKGKQPAVKFKGFHPDYKGDTASAADIDDCAYSAEVQAALKDMSGNPKTLPKAQGRPDWPKWQDAMDRKISTLQNTGTWSVVPQPADKNIVGSKWVFRIKCKADGSVDKYKAHLVARGFTQVYGEDYLETFSPIAKLTSFRTILAFTTRYNWDIETFDFNSAYLNGDLNQDKEIYMQPPPGYDSMGEGNVLRLHKSLYGLKQARQRWYDTLVHTLTDLGFRISQADPGVLQSWVQGDTLILAIHVDDCMLTSSSSILIAEYKKKIHAIYPLTDLGQIHWLLGIKITRDREAQTVTMSQESYIKTIIKRFALESAKGLGTPMIPGVTYS